MASPILRWCPQCEQDSLPMNDGRCAWCDTPTQDARRRRGKPVGKWGLMTDDHLRHAHSLYVRHGLSMRKLGALLYERFGFASAKSCSMALCNGWQRLALPARDRIEATVRASTTHGRLPRVAKSPDATPEQRAARGLQRQITGEVRAVRCAARRTQYPNKGAQCKNAALAGGDYCWAHDPDRARERARQLAAMRSRIAA